MCLLFLIAELNEVFYEKTLTINIISASHPFMLLWTYSMWSIEGQLNIYIYKQPGNSDIKIKSTLTNQTEKENTTREGISGFLYYHILWYFLFVIIVFFIYSEKNNRFWNVLIFNITCTSTIDLKGNWLREMSCQLMIHVNIFFHSILTILYFRPNTM